MGENVPESFDESSNNNIRLLQLVHNKLSSFKAGIICSILADGRLKLFFSKFLTKSKGLQQ